MATDREGTYGMSAIAIVGLIQLADDGPRVLVTMVAGFILLLVAAALFWAVTELFTDSRR